MRYTLRGETSWVERGGKSMLTRSICAAALAAGLSVAFALPADALTRQECSAKYQAAKQAGTLGGKTWNDFRKAECGSAATPAPTATPATPPAPPPTQTAAKPPAGDAVFPSAVSPKYSTEKGGRARMHTCLDQYNANKANNANGGLRWIQKGGGYYSECTKRLKA
jgi:hypothetical protein